MKSAADIIREREDRRTDVGFEIEAPWARVRLCISSVAEAGEALNENLITEEGHAWLTRWLTDRLHTLAIRCIPVEGKPMLYSFDPTTRERTGRLTTEQTEPPPAIPTEDEGTIAIELSGPHETENRSGWLFLAATAPWKNRADLTGTGDTPGEALAALGRELDRHLTAHAFTLRAAEERAK